tara:strand:- start:2309 stop:3124 length:816 start_codon:yes stop_codon:yes gene_type:complete
MEVSQLTEISEKVIEAVEEASSRVMEIYDSDNFTIENKDDGSPVTMADRESNSILSNLLESLDIKAPILSEEGEVRKNKVSTFWLIDPLDGTKEFINKNGEFTVNVALIERGRPILGVVSAPAINEMFVGFAGTSFKLIDGKRISISPKKQFQDLCKVTVSKSHKSKIDQIFVDICKEEFGTVEELPTGSSLKLCRVAEGSANIYSRLGPTYQWDIAAGQAVVEASGGKVTSLEGEPLSYEFISEKKNPIFFCSGDPNYDWESLFKKISLD